jgi:hypothetical protein
VMTITDPLSDGGVHTPRFIGGERHGEYPNDSSRHARGERDCARHRMARVGGTLKNRRREAAFCHGFCHI